MSQSHASLDRANCKLGPLETVYGFPYRFCATCGVFHPDIEQEIASSTAAPVAAAAEARGKPRGRLTLVQSR